MEKTLKMTKCNRCKGIISGKVAFRNCKTYCNYCFQLSKESDEKKPKKESKFMTELIEKYGK